MQTYTHTHIHTHKQINMHTNIYKNIPTCILYTSALTLVVACLHSYIRILELYIPTYINVYYILVLKSCRS